MEGPLFRLPAKFDSNLSSETWVKTHAATLASYLPVEWTPMAEMDPELVVYMKMAGVPIDDRNDLAMVMSSLGVLGIVEVRPDFKFRRGPQSPLAQHTGPMH